MTFPAEKEQLVLDNMGLVLDNARKMLRTSSTELDIGDLVQVGSIGLMRAAERFDESKGNEFSTFAVHYIKGYMMRERSKVSHIHVPINVKDMALRITKSKLTEEKPEVIAEMFGARINRVRDALHYLTLKTMSYNRKNTYDSESTFENLLGVINEENWLMVNDFLSTLKPIYRELLREVMDGKTLAEIGKEWGKSRQTVHAMRVRIQKKWFKYAGEVLSV